MQKSFKIFILVILTIPSFGQTKGWTEDQQEFYAIMKSLCGYYKGKHYDTTQREYVFKKYVYFDNILDDTSKTRIRERTKTFDTLFYQMTHFIDSVGLENLDAKPTKFFRKNKAFFEPYRKRGELNEFLPFTLTYFDKRKPNLPIGTLLFEPKTRKLLAWIVINQGGYHYFLTFNLI